MNTNRQPQYRTIETDTIDFLRAQVAALTKENERLKALAYPKELRVVMKPLDMYPACNKPIHEPNYAV